MPAQTQRPGTFLAPDSPELYKSFFYTHNDLSNFAAQKIAAEPASKSRLDDGTAKILQVNQDDLPKITVVSRQVVADLKAIDDEERAHLNKRAKLDLGPDLTLMKGFTSRRQAVVSAGVDKLTKTLPPASWAGLHAFVNERHRQSIRVVDVRKK